MTTASKSLDEIHNLVTKAKTKNQPLAQLDLRGTPSCIRRWRLGVSETFPFTMHHNSARDGEWKETVFGVPLHIVEDPQMPEDEALFVGSNGDRVTVKFTN